MLKTRLGLISRHRIPVGIEIPQPLIPPATQAIVWLYMVKSYYFEFGSGTQTTNRITESTSDCDIN